MTPAEAKVEYDLRIQERLGHLLEDRPATLSAWVEAENEAKAWLELARRDGLIDEA